MRKLAVFNQVSLDGYFTDANNDLGWAHRPRDDDEWNAFVSGNAQGGGTLVFGRVTYELMIKYWPTPAAMKNDPVVAEGMNKREKLVFSRTLDQASWKNTRVLNGDPAAEIKKLKQEPGSDMVILGSGSIVAQLAPTGLIDEYQLVVNPLVLGKGRTLFEGLKDKLSLKLTRSRSFNNGNVLLCYE